jgi:hypothetical protein
MAKRYHKKQDKNKSSRPNPLAFLGILLLAGLILTIFYRLDASSNNDSKAMRPQEAVGSTSEPLPSPATPVVYVTQPVPSWTAVPIGSDPGFNEPAVSPTPVFATPGPTLGPDAPWGGSLSLYRISDVQVSTQRAEAIFVGTVVEVGPARWTTVDGKRPSNPHSPENKDTIFRPVRVAAETYFKGMQTQTEFVLFAYGGVVGKDALEWASDDLQTFTPGERVLLFLSNPPQMSQYVANTKLALWKLEDKFTLTSDGMAVNTYGKMPLDRLVEQIESARQQNGTAGW